jgi:hypothetical protein
MSSDTEVHFPGIKKIPADPLRKRHNHEAKGMILKLDYGLIVVPFRYDGDKGWGCVVVGGTGPNLKSYPRGGYDVVVPAKEIERAEELKIPGLEAEG